MQKTLKKSSHEKIKFKLQNLEPLNINVMSFIYHFKENFKVSLNMKLYFVFGSPLNPYSGVYRGIYKNYKTPVTNT